MVRPPKRIIPNPSADPDATEAPVPKRSTSKLRYMTSGPQPAAQQPAPEAPAAPTTPKEAIEEQLKKGLKGLFGK